MKASTVSDLLFSKLNFTANRQKIIASNIANINTPNYKTKDISFEHTLNKKINNDLELVKTNKNHISPSYITPKDKINYFEVKNLEEQNDGNNVNLDQQIVKMAENKIMNKVLTNSIKKDAMWFKMIVDESSKN
jgi:flagellar basal-body rod protein FlgB